MSETQLDNVIKRVFNIERDCEKRTIQFIKKHNIFIDVEAYTREANCYLIFHKLLKYTRKWYTKNRSPFKNDSLLNVCSNSRLETYKSVNKSLLNRFKKEYA